MKVKGLTLLKIVVSSLLSCGILGTFIYVCVKGDLEHNILSWACVIACFVLSLAFVKIKSPSIFVTLALALTCASDYFLMYDIAKADNNQLLIGLYILCGVQFCYFLYTLMINKSIAGKVANIALRVALCLALYFILPKYYLLGTLEIVALMYYANLFVTFLELLFHLKSNLILAFGMLLLLVANFWLGMAFEGAVLFGLPMNVVEIFVKNNVAMWLYIPSLLVIALGSVYNLTLKKKEI